MIPMNHPATLLKLQALMPGTPSSDHPSPQRAIAGHPRRDTWNLVDAPSAGALMSCGVWHCEPGHWRIAFPAEEHELFTVLEGRCRVHAADVVVAQGQCGVQRRIAVDVVGCGHQFTQWSANRAPKQKLLQQQPEHEQQARQAHQPTHLLQGVGQHALGVGGHHHPAGCGLALGADWLQHPAFGQGGMAFTQRNRPGGRAPQAGEQTLPLGVEHHGALQQAVAGQHVPALLLKAQQIGQWQTKAQQVLCTFGQFAARVFSQVQGLGFVLLVQQQGPHSHQYRRDGHGKAQRNQVQAQRQ